MKYKSTEKFIEKLGAEIYPITIVKFLLNKRRILSYFAKAADKDFELRIKYTTDYSDCEQCKIKEPDGVLCRQHTSIDRVLTAEHVGFDLDTNVYFYRNEIFRPVGSRLVIVYCPHPKLITGEMTDSKVRKINPITIEEPSLELPVYNYNIREFISTDLLNRNMSCWFNNEYTLITLPEDGNGSNWCLISNR